MAKDCTVADSQRLDENEFLDLMLVDIDGAVSMVMNGTIDSNGAAHLILRVARMLGI